MNDPATAVLDGAPGPLDRAGPGASAPGRQWTGWSVAGLAAFSAVTAMAVAHWVFPAGSVDNDEAIYRLQADTLAHGHLFPRAPSPAASFQPWLAAVSGHHYVLKYAPPEAVLLAASRLIAGSYLPALAAVAAATVLATWALAREVLGDTRRAVLAGALVSAAPLVIVQSGLLLAYLPTVALLEVFAWAGFRAVRLVAAREVRPDQADPRRWAVISGVSFGAAAFLRPYDALLFGLPVGVWAAWRLRGGAATVGRWWALGVAPLAALTAAYNWAATGSPIRFPFNLLEPSDTLGFGIRRMYPGDLAHDFGLVQGLAGVGNHLWLLLWWVAGGPVIVVLAVAGVVRRHHGPIVPLAATAATVAGGYLAFWGAWNAADGWRGLPMVGPFYVLPLVVPLSVAAAAAVPVTGPSSGWPRRGWMAAGVAMVVITATVTAQTLAADATASRQDAAIAALSRQQDAALVFLATGPPFLMHPVGALGNGWSPSGRVVYAVATRAAVDVVAVESRPQRTPYLLEIPGGYAPRPRRVAARLRRLSLVKGQAVAFTVSVPVGEVADAAGLAVTVGGATLSCGPPPADGQWRIVVGGAGTVSCAPSGGIAVLDATSIRFVITDGGRGTTTATLPLRLEPSGGRVATLVPGPAVGVVGTMPPDRSPVVTADNVGGS